MQGDFDYLHKKQSGGQGQYGRVAGWIEPVDDGEGEFVFENQLIGNAIPPNFVTAVEKGFREAVQDGPMLGHHVEEASVNFDTPGHRGKSCYQRRCIS